SVTGLVDPSPDRPKSDVYQTSTVVSSVPDFVTLVPTGTTLETKVWPAGALPFLSSPVLLRNVGAGYGLSRSAWRAVATARAWAGVAISRRRFVSNISGEPSATE